MRHERRSATVPRRIGAALVGVFVAAGVAAILISPDQPQLAPALVKVYNLETQCQRQRTRECRLGLARDPYARYTAANVGQHVWHNDVLRAECYVSDGTRVESEDGRPSTRWYRVTGASGDDPGAPPGEKGVAPGRSPASWHRTGAAPLQGRLAAPVTYPASSRTAGRGTPARATTARTRPDSCPRQPPLPIALR